MISCGIDLVEIRDIQRAYMRVGEALAQKVLGANELAIWQAINLPAKKISFLAKRFAAKEALLKAVKLGLQAGMSWKYIQVRSNERGDVVFDLTSDFYNCLLQAHSLPNYQAESKLNISLSLSDTSEYAVAQVVLEW